VTQCVKILLALLLGAALLAGCGSQEQGGQSKEEAAAPSTTESSEKSSTTKREAAAERTAMTRKRTAPAPDPINLSGNGQAATQSFSLENGLVIARMTYQGESNFIVNVLDGNGNRAGDSLANVIGSFQGSYATHANAGEYLLDVQASGPWTVTIEQPRPSSAPETRSFQGTAKSATDFFTLSQGLARFELTHQGQHNFIVNLLDENGVRVGMTLVNEIGPFQGSKAVQVPKDGIYLFQVEADGPWAIQLPPKAPLD
jgi:hypothetical protein